MNFFKEITFKNKKFLPKYDIGDVVWAEMPLSLDNYDLIDHKIRPYLIVGFDYENNKYKALMSTTKRGNVNNSSIVINEKTNKISYILTNCVWYLDDENILNFMHKISYDDALDITKRLCFSCKEASELEFVNKYISDVEVKAGDFIQIGDDKYYLYALENDKYHLFKLYRSLNIDKNHKKNNEYIYKNGFYIRISKPLFIDVNIPCILINSLKQTDIIDIEEKRKSLVRKNKMINKSKKNKKLESNSLIDDSKNLENKFVVNKESMNDNDNIIVHFGDIVKYGNFKFIYMFTNEIEGVHYLINISKIKNNPFHFWQRKPIATPFIKVGSLNDDELLELLRFIKPLLGFLPSKKISNDAKEIVDAREKAILRKRV